MWGQVFSAIGSGVGKAVGSDIGSSLIGAGVSRLENEIIHDVQYNQVPSPAPVYNQPAAAQAMPSWLVSVGVGAVVLVGAVLLKGK